MPIVLRILRVIVVAALLVTVAGLSTMASAAMAQPCCDDEDDGDADERPSLGADDCSPFCFSCPSRTVAPVSAAAGPEVAIVVTGAPAPVLAAAAPTDPPRRGVFHPPRPWSGDSFR